MNVPMAFGKGQLLLSLPEGPRYTVINAHTAQPVVHVQAALDRALDSPIGCPPLADLARGKKKRGNLGLRYHASSAE